MLRFMFFTHDLQVVRRAELEVLGAWLRADRDVSGAEVEASPASKTSSWSPQSNVRRPLKTQPSAGTSSGHPATLHERSSVEVLVRGEELNRGASRSSRASTIGP